MNHMFVTHSGAKNATNPHPTSRKHSHLQLLRRNPKSQSCLQQGLTSAAVWLSLVYTTPPLRPPLRHLCVQLPWRTRWRHCTINCSPNPGLFGLRCPNSLEVSLVAPLAFQPLFTTSPHPLRCWWKVETECRIKCSSPNRKWFFSWFGEIS